MKRLKSAINKGLTFLIGIPAGAVGFKLCFKMIYALKWWRLLGDLEQQQPYGVYSLAICLLLFIILMAIIEHKSRSFAAGLIIGAFTMYMVIVPKYDRSGRLTNAGVYLTAPESSESSNAESH